MPSRDRQKQCPRCKSAKPLTEFIPDLTRCRVCQRERMRAWSRKVRSEVLAHYGGRCACCNEACLSFLGINHIQDGDNQHRKSRRTPLYPWLKKNKFPTGFRVLCHNCNMALGFYGYCPHQNPNSIQEPACPPQKSARAAKSRKTGPSTTSAMTNFPPTAAPATTKNKTNTSQKRETLETVTSATGTAASAVKSLSTTEDNVSAAENSKKSF